MENIQEYAKNVMCTKTTQTHSSVTNSEKIRIKYFHCMYEKTETCWKWLGCLSPSGYGSFKFNGKTWRAHRLMWFLINGEIKDNLYVLHKCDVRDCVNPDHLFLGTADDNLKDCMAKGRFRVSSGLRHGTKTHPERKSTGHRHGTRTHPEAIARGDRHGSKIHPNSILRGEQRPYSKLKTSDVLNIRNLSRNETHKQIANRFKVSRQLVGLILNKKIWKHV